MVIRWSFAHCFLGSTTGIAINITAVPMRRHSLHMGPALLGTIQLVQAHNFFPHESFSSKNHIVSSAEETTVWENILRVLCRQLCHVYSISTKSPTM